MNVRRFLGFIFACVLLLDCFSSLAQSTNAINVTWTFTDFNLTAQAVVRATQTPLQPFADYNGAILTAAPRALVTSTNGSVTFSNTVPGYAYRIQLDTAYGSTIRTSGFPAQLTGNVNGRDYLGDVHAMTFYYLYTTNGVGFAIQAGTNVFLTTNTGVIKIDVPISGGGSATNAIGKTNGVGVGTTTLDKLSATNVTATSGDLDGLIVTNQTMVGNFVERSDLGGSIVVTNATFGVGFTINNQNAPGNHLQITQIGQPGSVLDFSASILTAPTFNGNLNASQLSSGTVPESRIGLAHTNWTFFSGNGIADDTQNRLLKASDGSTVLDYQNRILSDSVGAVQAYWGTSGFGGNGTLLTNLNGSAISSTILQAVLSNALTNSAIIHVYTNGTAWGPAGPINTANTKTMGLQEAWDAIPRATAFGQSAIGAVVMQPGNYNCATQLWINQNFPFQPLWNLNHAQIQYTGSLAQDFIVTSYNPSFSATNTLRLTIRDGTISYASNYTQKVMSLGGVQDLIFDNVQIARGGKVYGVSAFQETDYGDNPGLVGVFLKSSQNPKTYFYNSTFSGLADGIWCQADDLIVQNCVFVGVGDYFTNSAWVYNSTLWTSGIPSIGAAVIFDSNSGSHWSFNNEYAFVGAALYLPQPGPGIGGRAPLLRGGSISAAYRVLTRGGQPAIVDSLLSSANNGDSLVTNSAAGLIQPANVSPNNVYEYDFKLGQFRIGQSNNAFTVNSSTGDTTNRQQILLNGSAQFTATVTTTSNLWIGRGGTASVNKLYTRTNPAASGSGTVSWWTNAASGGFIVDDSGFSGYNQNDATEIYDKNGISLYSAGTGIIDPGSIESMVFTPTGGSSPVPNILYFYYSDSLASPKATLPQTAVTNLTASRAVLTDGSKNLISAAASGAIPINADGSATTFTQVNALAPGNVLTNGESQSTTFSNQLRVDVTHAFVASNATATAIAGFDAGHNLTNINIDATLSFSGNTLSVPNGGAGSGIPTLNGNGTNTTLYFRSIAWGTNQTSAASTGSAMISGEGNSIPANNTYTVIVGGLSNALTGAANTFSFIGGGVSNTVGNGNTGSAVLGGGIWNTTSGAESVLAGGRTNMILGSAPDGVIAGGATNIINSRSSAILGGNNNYVTTASDGTAILGGINNIASNALTSIVGGTNSYTAGNRAIALGTRARSTTGSTTISDSQEADFNSYANDSFNIRAQGGIFMTAAEGYYTNTSGTKPNFLLKHTLCTTNAAFTILAPSNVDSTKTLDQDTDFWVTNSTGSSFIVITPPANVWTNGTWACTNITQIHFHCHAGVGWTNATSTPWK